MNKLKNIIWTVVIGLLIVAAGYAGYRLAFRGLVFPRVSISGIEVTGLDKAASLNLVKEIFQNDTTSIILRNGDKEITKINNLKIERDFVWAADQSIAVGRNGNLLTQIKEQYDSLFSKREILVPIGYDEEELNNTVDQIISDLNDKPVYPKLIQTANGVTLVKGKDGVEVKSTELSSKIKFYLAFPGKQLIDVPTSRVSVAENNVLVDKAIKAINIWGDKKLILKSKDFEHALSKEDMMKLLGLISEPIDETEFKRLVDVVKDSVETTPRDAIFNFEEGRVKEFKPEIVGTIIDLPSFKEKLGDTILAAKDNTLEIPVILTYPKIRTGDINNLGIKELIGSGKSTFYHSIPGRVFNVNLAGSRINGTLVEPGETFSFNEAVGEISKATGYQSAYIISGGKTVLGDGGGVCQVSTTVFRAALNAGLPITERKAHAYRVGYYEQDSKPGIDATVFSPSADLKFTNDTGQHVLIQTKVDTKKLTMTVDIYGTSDGRKSTVTEPIISSQTPPPATLYVDDPTLVAGSMKQIDWSAWGAKVSFDYKVERDGKIVTEKTFYSNYQPWQAIYLKGTKTN